MKALVMYYDRMGLHEHEIKEIREEFEHLGYIEEGEDIKEICGKAQEDIDEQYYEIENIIPLNYISESQAKKYLNEEEMKEYRIYKESMRMYLGEYEGR